MTYLQANWLDFTQYFISRKDAKAQRKKRGYLYILGYRLIQIDGVFAG